MLLNSIVKNLFKYKNDTEAEAKFLFLLLQVDEAVIPRSRRNSRADCKEARSRKTSQVPANSLPTRNRNVKICELENLILVLFSFRCFHTNFLRLMLTRL